jgi:predicted nucleic acid-binding protein
MAQVSSYRYLLDTNLIIYFHDDRYPVKQTQSQQLLAHLIPFGHTVLSTQALAEFSNVALRKFEPKLDWQTIQSQVNRLLLTFPVLPLTPSVVQEALRGVGRFQFSYWDAQFWAIARLHQIQVILSEDCQHEACFEGITYINPFFVDVKTL